LTVAAFFESLNTFYSVVLWKGCFDVEDHTRILSPNTVIFAQLKPEVALVIVDIVAAITSVLRWRQVSQNLLFAILTRIGECDFFDCSHANFSAAIWSYLNGSAREDKFSKWLTKLKEDMALSKFFPVDVKKPRPDRHEDGSFRSRPTRYLPGVFWNLYYVVQDEALKCDLFSFEKDERRAWIRAIVKRWLGEHGALAIERVKKDDKVKPPNPSLPCKCACASCQTCAAKSVTGSEAEKRPAQERITKSGVALRMGNALEELFECGAQWANLELDMKEYWVKVTTEISVLDQRLAGAVKRHNAPKVKMNGGQPK